MSSSETITCKTGSNWRSYDIEWKIPNTFYGCRPNGHSRSSGTFTTGTDPKIDWNIRLYSNGKKTGVELCVDLNKQSKVETTVEYSFSILDIKRTKCFSTTTIRKLNFSDSDSPVLITLDELNKNNKLYSDGAMTILCELKVLDQKLKTIVSLSEDFKNLLTTPEGSDITISVSEKKFPVHKAILVTRSPVFSAMFKNDLEESRSNIVEISDIEPEVMEEALLYMYTGKCNKLYEIPKKLIHVAEKYQLVGLKYLCELVLSEQLSCDNAADTLIIADFYNSNELKDRILQFINEHSKEVLGSTSWKYMAPSNPNLKMEVLESMVNHHIMLK